MLGVFVHRRDTHYDDRPDVRYQFPKQYLSRAQQFERDWAVYYEPLKAGGRGFYALGFVERILPDSTSANMFVAQIKTGTYLDFAIPVPYRDESGNFVESGLSNAQAAVRPLSHVDFAAIINRGLRDDEPILPRVDLPMQEDDRLREVPIEFAFEQPRLRIESLVSRPFRDRIFRSAVIGAYGNRCAISGLKFINGGGRAEVEAAHIRPVERSGPDSVNNGIALSGTAHWMFDRGLIGISDGLDVMISRHVNDMESVDRLLQPNRRAFAPDDPSLRPHPSFLTWHRENVFKG
jgi:putative restriction endonuclease